MPVTTAGTEVENYIEYDLERNGYNVETQVAASGINQEWSKIDIVLHGDIAGCAEALSLKYQDVAGTARRFSMTESLSLMCQDTLHKRYYRSLRPGWSPVKYNWFLNICKLPSRTYLLR